jgi:hypothetical protein
VAVRAKHAEILKAMIVPDAVAMIDLDGDGFPPPLRETALLADVD